MTKCVFIDYLVRRFGQLNKGMYKKVTYVRMCKFMIQKEKSLFIPIKLHSITISSVIPYISEITVQAIPSKKKEGKMMCERKREKEREKKERKRECERKEEKDGKEKEKEKEKKRN